MATISAVATTPAAAGLTGPAGGRTMTVTWETITEADTGASIQIDGKAVDAVIHAFGTWGGETLAIEGSNNNSSWFDLKDESNTTIALTANGIVSLSVLPLYIRPAPAAAGSSTDIDVVLALRFL